MNPFSALTSKIFGGLALVLLLAVIVQTVRLGDANEALEDKRNELATCEAQHAVTRQSVDTLDAVIEDLNERALARGEAYEAAKAEATRNEAKLEVLAEESDRRISELRKLAREQVNGDCPTPPELRALAEGL